MYMHAPQIIYLSIMALNLLAVVHDAGKTKSNIKIWITFATTAMFIGLLIWGGFFK